MVAIDPSGSSSPVPALRWARMQHKNEFDLAMSSKHRVRTGHLVLHLAMADPVNFSARISHKLGLVVPKRWARRAVTRNAIRRIAFAEFQQVWSMLPAGAYVIRLAQGWSTTEFPSAWSCALRQVVRSEVSELLQRAVTMPAVAISRGVA